jgi:small-conductance mechanosensitive channel
LLNAVDGAEHVSEEPAPRVRFRSFGDSGLDFELLAWIEEPVYRGKVIGEMTRADMDMERLGLLIGGFVEGESAA